MIRRFFRWCWSWLIDTDIETLHRVRYIKDGKVIYDGDYDKMPDDVRTAVQKEEAELAAAIAEMNRMMGGF